MKGIGIGHYLYPVLSSPSLRLIVAIDATYHLTIGIAEVTNAFYDTLKASSERDIIEFPHHYISWFKFLLSTIHIEPTHYVQYAMDICHVIQGTNTAGHHWNNVINLVLSSLVFLSI